MSTRREKEQCAAPGARLSVLERVAPGPKEAADSSPVRTGEKPKGKKSKGKNKKLKDTPIVVSDASQTSDTPQSGAPVPPFKRTRREGESPVVPSGGPCPKHGAAFKPSYVKTPGPKRTAEYGVRAQIAPYDLLTVPESRLARFPAPEEDGSYLCPFCPSEMRG
jgi:hypothetical protein